MDPEIWILLSTAFTLGLLHTLLGPDHYLPFIAMSKSCKWSKRKTLMITSICGIGHILGSVLLGIIGVAIGISLNFIDTIESIRGEIASWALISFGFMYLVWGVKYAINKNKNIHWHSTNEGKIKFHSHKHLSDHLHPNNELKVANLTPWILFIIFVFGPCEVLIPLLIYPSQKLGYMELSLVIFVFGITTIITMNFMVFLSLSGLKLFNSLKLNNYYHALAGGVLLIGGILVQFFEL